MADEPIKDITFADQLRQIQSQLASLETSYANIVRTYYDMFYNSNPMDVTIQVYDEDGVLRKITVPNRAKASTSSLVYNGDPSGVLEGTLGALVIDTYDNTLWYKITQSGTDGWVKLVSDRTLSDEYLKKNGNGELLSSINAGNITGGTLEVAYGGLGTSDVTLSGILKMIPQKILDDGTVIKAHIETAQVGDDYLDTANLSGMIVFFPIDQVKPGYLVCNGDMYSKETYKNLYTYLSKEGTQECPYGETATHFAVPTMHNLTVKCTTDYTDRAVGTTEEDGVPNFKATWSAEVTGAEQNYTGVVQIATDADGKYKQVDGKTSAPSGSYDYLIEMNPQEYNDACARVYKDDATEVTVKNIALVPAIKY